MKRRILISHLIISLISVALFTLLVRTSTQISMRSLVLDALQKEGSAIARRLQGDETLEEILEHAIIHSRITLMDEKGQVLYDSDAVASQMENHLDRPEVDQALSAGRGSSMCWSDTLRENMLYYAQRMSTGHILRLAGPVRTLDTLFTSMLPWLVVGALLIVLASSLLSRRLTRGLLAPLDQIDLAAPAATPAYEELTPLLTRIMEQNIESDLQIAKLNEKQQEMDLLLDGMSEGFLALDPQHRIVRANHSVLNMLGADGEGVLGRTLPEINRRPEILRMLADLRSAGTATATMELNGRSYLITANNVSGERGSVVLMRDMTEKDEAETARKRFTANVSHELRTPLTTICGYSELLAGGLVKPEDQQDFFEKILRESKRMLTLVEDILRLSKLDEGYPGGRRERVNLLDIVKQAAAALEASAQKKGVTQNITGERHIVVGDPTLLYELVSNLMDNAIKYNKPGGRVDVSLDSENGGVSLRVSDTGIGIDPRHQDKIFERFYRTDKSRSKGTGGTGLGLSIVKHSAEYHAATLHVQSQLGQGTTITVFFPEAIKRS
jgi:two-component system phosphate regulon sensor histidine kinase PhoR